MFSIIMLSVAFLISCNPNKEDNNLSFQRNTEAREDSIKLASAYNLQSKIKSAVFPITETDPVKENPMEDAADDPALWHNAHDPGQSRVFGTNKKNGIYAYDLEGKEVAFYPFGMINNIDIRQSVKYGDQYIDVLGGSNRTDNSVVLYTIDSLGNLKSLLQKNFLIDTTDIDEVYGFCLYKDYSAQASVLVNGKNGKINQYAIAKSQLGYCKLEPQFSWKLNSQPEGMVADDDLAFLYIGEEERGIWKISLENPNQPPVIITDSQAENNPDIAYDIEGLALSRTDSVNGFLLASIQGSFSYAIFDRLSNKYLGSFTILENGQIDGVEETDGIDIFTGQFGGPFEEGILVAQDGFNYEDSVLVGQNFKYVNLEEVLKLVESLRRKEIPI